MVLYIETSAFVKVVADEEFSTRWRLGRIIWLTTS